MPTASITASGPRPSVSSRIGVAEVVVVLVEVEASTPRARGARQPLGHQVDADHLPAPRCRAIAARHVADRAEPEHGDACRPSGTSAYSTACHAVGSTSER